MEEEIKTTTVTETVETDKPENEGDDYRWLTERLDAHTAELREAKQLLQSTWESAMIPMRESMNQLQETNRQLAGMVETMSQTLTALAASAMLKSTQPSSESSSVVEEPEPEVIIQPESVVEESQAPETKVEQRKRRKL